VLKIIHANNSTVVFDSGDRWNISSTGSTFTLIDPSRNLTLNSNGLGAINFTPKLVGINKNEALTIFRQDPGIAGAIVKVFPPWKKYFPNELSKIDIILK
jgi:hypothetical protein